jgi:hypothetical protein
MAVYRVQDDQGNSFKLEGPDDANDEELQQAIAQYQSGDKPQSKIKGFVERVGKKIGETVAPVAEPIGQAMQGLEEQQGEQAAGLPGMIAKRGMEGYGYFKKPFEAVGAAAEEKLTEAGYPETGYLAGKGIEYFPELVSGAGSAVETGLAQAAAQAAGKGLKSAVVKPLAKAGKAILGEGENVARAGVQADVSAAQGVKRQVQQSLSKLAEKKTQAEEVLPKLKARYGRQMGAAESEAGINLTTLPKFAKEIIDNPTELATFANTAAELSTKPVAELATLPLKQKQVMRKMLEEIQSRGVEVGKLDSVRLSQLQSKLGEAIGEELPKFGEARTKFAQVAKNIEELPGKSKRETAALRRKLQSASQSAADVGQQGSKRISEAAKRDQLRKRLLIGSLITGGLGGVSRFIP